ncbi:MAG: hypothetical protein KC800_31665, partial [Candidatus Eremiobacteraeota bacterium]|nr:hypothetical protein [Candidatus Eremiobacteraeota bacterium]
MSRPTRLRHLLLSPLLLLSIGCTPKLPPPETSSPTPAAISIPSAVKVPQPKFDPQKYSTMTTALNSFGQRLFTEVAKSGQGNLAVSPVGPFVLLELLREGAAAAALSSLDFSAPPEDGDIRVTLELPRFEVKTPELELTDALKALGASALVEGADLSRSLDSPDAQRMVVRTFQQAIVRVDEAGTLAAATTEMIADAAATPNDDLPQKIELHFDHPFAFAL